MGPRLLLIDDEIEFCKSTSKLLGLKGFNVIYATDSQKVIELLEKKNIDMVLLDIRMPDINGIDLLRMIKDRISHIPVIIISGHATVDVAVQAMKYGALNLYTKPLKIPELVVELNQFFYKNEANTQDVQPGSLITENSEMKRIVEMCDVAAETSAPVLR
jgi:DNA-binding NtrC family response regulator